MGDCAAAKRPRKETSDRDAVLEGITQIVRTYFADAKIVEKIVSEEGAFNATSESVQALFFVKKTSTIQRRFSSLRIYAQWFETEALAPEQFVDEGIVFRYVKFLHSENAPATRASSLREALNFLGGVLSVDLTDMQKSTRIKGMCCRLQRSGHAVRQRDPLSKAMLEDLEILLAKGAEAGAVDSVLAATALFCVYARTRVGDLRKCINEPIMDMAEDRSCGTLETKFFDHKTARPGTRKALPVAAPVFGVTKVCWGEHFVTARRAADLRAEDGGGLVPALGPVGWQPVPYTTAEFATALRDLLKRRGFSTSAISNIGSHSLKATLLSWAGKYGMDKDHRRLLGYHTLAGDRSADTYVRDLLSAPLRSLDAMLSEVREGTFIPDGARSGTFAQPVPADADDDEETLTTCSSESARASDDELLVDEEMDNKVLMNTRNSIYHITASADLLACKKPWPKGYEITGDPPAGARLCRRCF